MHFYDQNPETMRLEDKLQAYAASDDYGFHMPGHKRQTAANPFLGNELALASIDITEIPGFDDLHEPEGILKNEMAAAAKFYGTKATIFSVNGSTASNLAAISAAVPFEGHFLSAENCHRSVPHAIMLRHLKNRPLKTMPFLTDVPGGIDPLSVREALKAQPAAAVMITSPTYEGVVSDVAAIAEEAHRAGALLIVDEAHGAHFSRHPAFPVSAVKLGADLVVHSLHKTLPSLTQTSVLHNVSGRVSTDSLMEWMDVYESSSPSYILMASITSCLHTIMDQREAYFAPYVERLLACREKLAGLKHLRLVTKETLYDPSKLVIHTEGTALDGPALAEILRTKYHLVMEKVTPHYALAMTSAADTAEGFERLERALFEIDATL
ncbi:MAG: aminotransferase class V-fold PLP-dependent enzyme [Lachnospiraceae bacterium]|nr:aminotransferase class V-fold PLP-dependent enzyme [Lachnospiraceae bacterium]